MDKQRMKRMLQELKREQGRDSTRPLARVYITLDCGCEVNWPGSTETAPWRGQLLYCYHHMEETRVGAVNVRAG